MRLLPPPWSHRTLKRHPARFTFRRKNEYKDFAARWVRQSSRVFWRRDLGLLAPLGDKSFANLVHDFFEAGRLVTTVQDCRLTPIIYRNVDPAAGKTDSTFEVCHPANVDGTRTSSFGPIVPLNRTPPGRVYIDCVSEAPRKLGMLRSLLGGRFLRLS